MRSRDFGVALLLVALVAAGAHGGILRDLAADIVDEVKNTTHAVAGGVKNTATIVAGEVKHTTHIVADGVRNTTAAVVQEVKNSTGAVVHEVKDTTKAVANSTSNVAKDIKKAAAEIVDFSDLTYTNDCLGLGSTIGSQLESFFRKDANGSRAQDARFYFWSRKMPNRNEVVIGKQFGLEWTDFDIRRNTVMIVHGFLSNGNETWIHKMTEALLNWGDVNVIVVDWSDGGDTYNYYKAAINTQTTGNQIATLFGQIANYTTEKSGVQSTDQWGKIHCIGHSLGSHICGCAANEMKSRGAHWTFDRITGLDPAQPCFKSADADIKLDKYDAPFVDVIHTNGRIWSDFGLGLPQSIGHIDFYPNGGKQQPGCETSDFKIPIISIPQEAIAKMICSHGRSYLYFTDSIVDATAKNCTFWAQPWDKTYRNIEHILSNNCPNQMCTEMGINSDKYRMRGSFFTLTSTSHPYCKIDEADKEEAIKILKEDFKDSFED